MLAHLSSSVDYNDFIHSLPSEYSHLLSLCLSDSQYVSAVFKMIHLDVDSISDLLPLAYSHIGRATINQMEILRPFVLMLHSNCISIKRWCKSLTEKTVLAILIGCLPGEAPSSNHYDFISRIFNGFKYHSVYPPKRYGKPKSSKPKKNNKWENNRPGITEKAFDFYLNSDYDNNQVEFLLQQIFNKIAVEFSISHNLIDTSKSVCPSGDSSTFAFIHPVMVIEQSSVQKITITQIVYVAIVTRKPTGVMKTTDNATSTAVRLQQKKINQYPYCESCKTTEYGKSVYLKPKVKGYRSLAYFA